MSEPLAIISKFSDITFMGNQLWQYGLFLIVILLSVTLAKLLDYFLTEKVKKLTDKTKTRLDDIIAQTMRTPIKLIILVLGIKLGSGIFELPEKVTANLGNIFEALIAVVITVTIVKTVDLLIAYMEPKVKATESKLDDQLLPIIRKTTKIFILVVAVIVIIQNLGYNVVSLLTGLGIGGLAIALAAQETLSNFFGSIALFADRPFQVGDRVTVEGTDGAVESVGLRSTRIRTLDGTLVTMPNSKVANATINNIAKRPAIKNLYTLGVTYDTGYEKMTKALDIVRDIYKKHPSTDNYWVYFKEFGASSLNILAIHWCKYTAYEEFLKATEEINMEIMKQFEAQGIEIAFPTQTVYLKQDPAAKTN
ncbi:MAG: mechanosensitive ion channel family protein [Candidatus Omnitrophica bacterium]|nr:mechanosensitive ion channel family protein [Candidatus Omnitrophota bacterium]